MLKIKISEPVHPLKVEEIKQEPGSDNRLDINDLGSEARGQSREREFSEQNEQVDVEEIP